MLIFVGLLRHNAKGTEPTSIWFALSNKFCVGDRSKRTNIRTGVRPVFTLLVDIVLY